MTIIECQTETIYNKHIRKLKTSCVLTDLLHAHVCPQSLLRKSENVDEDGIHVKQRLILPDKTLEHCAGDGHVPVVRKRV